MRWFRLLALVYLVALASYLYGVYSGATGAWPFQLVHVAYAYVQGHPDEATTLWENILNDLGIRPERLLHDYAVADPATFREAAGVPTRDDRMKPLVRAEDDPPPGYIAIAGRFDLEGSQHGVLLFDTAGRYIHRWNAPAGDDANNSNHHLMHVRPDGSLVAAPDYGALYHVDWCGATIRRLDGKFHHSISALDETRYWVTGSVADRDAISLYDLESNRIERTVMLEDVHAALDPELALFEVTVGGQQDSDRWHNNDADPLTADSDRFPQFDTGDLLVSYRHGNLIYVLDPDTLSIRWWARDHLSGQHDPDWGRNGGITVYDNRALGKPGEYSTIVRYDPAVPEPEILLDGRRYGLHARIGGKHEVLANGSILLNAYEQGRVLLVGPDGDVRFEFVNRFDDDEVLVVLNAQYMPADYFEPRSPASLGETCRGTP